MYEFSFENLTAYKEARVLVKQVYAVADSIPAKERFALTQQLQRAIVSVPSNIAEGNGRNSLKEKIHFLEIAYGSLMESFCQVQIAMDLGYVNQETIENMRPQFITVAKLISALCKNFKDKLNQ